MYAVSSRAVRVTLGAMLAALAACADQQPPTAPMSGPTPQFAPGDEILVTSTSGGTDVGSLRWAASQVTGGEVIRFVSGLAGQTITLDSTVVLGQYATIEGPADQGITISGAGKGRVFEFTHYPGEVVLRNLTVTGGNYPDAGGAGIVSLRSPVRLENTTVTGNTSYTYPAVWSNRATLVNSTVSGNTATIPYSAGSVVNATVLSLVNSTVAYNGGGGVTSAQLVLQNSIIANHDRANCASTEILFQGRNLSDDDTCGGPGDILVTAPELGPLADNGGPTPTHALAATSPAINAGAVCSVTVDQRYVVRDALCDLGAFEAPVATTVLLTMVSNASVDGDGKVLVTGTLMCSQDETFDLQVELVQKRGRTVVSATGTASIACGTSAGPWQVELLPAGGRFQNGGAQATAITVNTPERVQPASLSQSIKLFTSKK